MKTFISMEKIEHIIQNYGGSRIWTLHKTYTKPNSKLWFHKKINKYLVLAINKLDDGEITVTLTDETGFIVQRDYWDCDTKSPFLYNTNTYTNNRACTTEIHGASAGNW